MTISMNLNNEDTQLITSFAKLHGISVAELARQSILEHIEDELDLKAYEEAKKEYLKNPKTYTREELEKELGL